MLSKDDGARGRVYWGAVHFLLRHGVEVFRFRLEPFIPVGASLEFAPSESAESLFSRGSEHSSIKRMHHDDDLIVR